MPINNVLADDAIMAAIKGVCGFDAEKAEKWRPEALVIARTIEREVLAAQQVTDAEFEWPRLPAFPKAVSTCNSGGLFAEHQMQGYANAYGEMVRAAVAQAGATLTADDPDMVWPVDDPETFYHSLDDAVEGEINNAWPVEAPLEFEFQVAKRLPTVTIRVTEITESGHEWEIVDAARAHSTNRSGGES